MCHRKHLLSYATPKEKNKKMTTSQGGSPSSILCAFTNCINIHKKFQPSSLVWFLLARSLSKCFIPYYTLPCNEWDHKILPRDASSGDVMSQIIKSQEIHQVMMQWVRSQNPLKRCIRWWCSEQNHKIPKDASSDDAVSEITKSSHEMH
jgi:hypothetical protein